MNLISTFPRGNRQSGILTIELVVAISILAAVLLPLAYGQWFETGALRTAYQRAVAMEIVDGELEVLAAGEWKQFSAGSQTYSPHAAAITNLPPGQFTLSLENRHIRLEWRPANPRHGRGVMREMEGRQ